jgi:hypothetical protein
LTLEPGSGSHAGGPARLIAGLGSFYALSATVVLLLLTDFFADEPNSNTIMLWLIVPVVSSFGTWVAVYSRFSPLRAWVWFAALASFFFCWISIFSIGVYYLPVPLLILITVLIPWSDHPADGDYGPL